MDLSTHHSLRRTSALPRPTDDHGLAPVSFIAVASCIREPIDVEGSRCQEVVLSAGHQVFVAVFPLLG